MNTDQLADQLDTVLMLRGETRHCEECATTTVFLPVDEAPSGPAAESAWVCTVCDAAVLLPVAGYQPSFSPAA